MLNGKLVVVIIIKYYFSFSVFISFLEVLNNMQQNAILSFLIF
jgi:hypothetical protein